jgi:hypothetical protein
VAEDLRQGKRVQAFNVEIVHCVAKLEEEWIALWDAAEVWRNRVDNTLANLRIFEDGLHTMENRLV